MTKEGIIKALEGHEPEYVEKYASYCLRLFIEKDKKTNQPKNPWIATKTDAQLADLFKRVAKEGLVFDGESVTLQSTGINYGYQAYKNKMFLAYPESQIDVSLVYEGEQFTTSKEDGKVRYTHEIPNPFAQKSAEIVGGYCVIKNLRGEFLTILNKEDIEKHRKVAKTDYIWAQWFKEMALKTVIKKACKQHFNDIYKNIEDVDNENYNLENPLGLSLKLKQEIDKIDNIEDLKEYYLKNKGQGKDFDKYITLRNNQLIQ